MTYPISPNNKLQQKSLDENFNGWLAGQLAESTRRLYRSDIEDFFGGVPTVEMVLSLTDNDLKEWRNKAIRSNPDDRDGLEASTVNRKLAALSSFYSYIQARGLISQNPASPKLVRRPKLDDWEPQLGLVPAEMAALIEACNKKIGHRRVQAASVRDLALITLLYTSILRRSEAANANWGDIQKQADHYWLRIPNAKGGYRQKVKVEPIAIQLLDRYLEEMKGKKEFEERFQVPFSQCPIFVALDNAHFFQRLSDHSVNSIVQKRAAIAALPQGQNISAHTLRHTGVTHMLLAGKSPLAVQTLARHKDLSTTMIYAALAQRLLESPGYVLAGNVEEVLTGINIS